MRINKQFIASQGAKALPSKPGGCCGTAASKRFVFPSDTPEPCCAVVSTIPNLPPVNDPDYTGFAQTEPYTFLGLECPMEFCVWPGLTYNSTDFDLFIVIDGNQYPLTNNAENCFSVTDQQVFYLSAFTREPGCFEVVFGLHNKTCDIWYPDASIFLNGSRECAVCDWDFTDIETLADNIYRSFHYNSGTVPITIRLYSDNNVANFTTNVIAYVNSTPTIGGTSYDLMQFGASLGDVDVTMNPGDYLIIYQEAPDLNCADTYLIFTNVTCGNHLIGQIQSIEVNKGAC
jgi:hypothetical protein